MAYSILLSLENIINQILDQDRFPISPLEKEHIISINKCVISFQAFLEEFPKKAKNLEARIRSVAVEAESTIECFLHEELYSEWIAKSGIYQLEKLRGEMESIAAEVEEMQNSIIIEDVQVSDLVEATSLPQVADSGEINMVGFNEDLVEIKEKLCGWAPQLQVLPISGMGGIGKTTLARNAYNDQLIMEHFQVRVWITISQDYSLRRILLGLLDSLKEFNTDWRKESMATRSEKGNEALANKSDHEIESVAKRSQQLD